MRDYNIPYTIGWTEHDKLEVLDKNHIKVWNFFPDFPYSRGNGYKIINDKYDVNGIFKTI